MKLPASVGQKKTKAIEQVLEELGIGKSIDNFVNKINFVSTLIIVWQELTITSCISHLSNFVSLVENN